MTRHFDIVVWGATGFTGRLITEYLAAHAPDHVKLAVAGRNKQKLEQILASANPHNRVISILIGEADDLASLDAIAIQTKVVISSAGPYLKYGFGLVDACVRSKTDYVDLTGEPEFIRAIIEKHHEQAQRDGTLIVPSCGFDSVPSDLGTLMYLNLMQDCR